MPPVVRASSRAQQIERPTYLRAISEEIANFIGKRLPIFANTRDQDILRDVAQSTVSKTFEQRRITMVRNFSGSRALQSHLDSTWGVVLNLIHTIGGVFYDVAISRYVLPCVYRISE